MPKELAEGDAGKGLDAIAQQMPERIYEESQGTTFVAQVTIPFTKVRGFLKDGLKLKESAPGETLAFIDEMIKEHQAGSSLLTGDQIGQLREGEGH